MKQIIRNKYVKVFKFTSLNEASTFFKNQTTKVKLFIEDTYGDNHYCYVCYHSLTKEQLFSLVFSSDIDEENLNFLFWDDILVVDTGKSIYIIDENLNIKTCFEITTPLIGLYITNSNKLLFMEEAYIRLINNKGEVLNSVLVDLIEDFSINDNLLFIHTSGDDKIIDLS